MYSNLDDKWRNGFIVEHSEPPLFYLKKDKTTLDELNERGRTKNKIKVISDQNWDTLKSNENYGNPNAFSKGLHLNLIPQPYMGNLNDSKIYILLLNPGVGPSDYYGEYTKENFKELMINNIKQNNNSESHPFLFLNPEHSWHGGYQWWHNKLKQIILVLSKKWEVNYSTARERLSKEVCSIELLPYHSETFGITDKELNKLESVKLVKKYLHEVILNKVRKRKAILIVTRSIRHWGLNEEAGVTLYTGGETRGASLSPKSRGGKAILNFYGIKQS